MTTKGRKPDTDTDDTQEHIDFTPALDLLRPQFEKIAAEQDAPRMADLMMAAAFVEVGATLAARNDMRPENLFALFENTLERLFSREELAAAQMRWREQAVLSNGDNCDCPNCRKRRGEHVH